MNFYDFNPGSSKPVVHIAHANGFPPATYQLAVKPLLDHFHVVSLSKDLIEGLEQFGQPVIAVGHSLGGVATLMAATERPELFSQVVLMDPTMLPPDLLRKFWWMKLFGMTPRIDLVEGALCRRRHWESREIAFSSFKGKRLFEKWPEEIFVAYVEGMTRVNPQGGFDLAYSADWEAQIYRTIPTDVWKWVPQLQQPTLVLRGGDSNTFVADSEKAFEKIRPQTQFATVLGAGHLVAQEAPK